MTAEDTHIRKWIVVVMLLVTASLKPFQVTMAAETNTTQQLATELAEEGRHEAAAIEYRRLALSETRPELRAGYYWAAAYEYVKEKNFDLASRMLDRVDENSQQLAVRIKNGGCGTGPGVVRQAVMFGGADLDRPLQ